MMNGPDDLVGPVNFGNPKEFTILQLATKIIDLTESKSKVIFNPLPQDDPTRRQPDIHIAKEKLGWQPKISLEEGLKKTIDYFKSLHRNGLLADS
jgi:UDP-glucuronate decarboxylase